MADLSRISIQRARAYYQAVYCLEASRRPWQGRQGKQGDVVIACRFDGW